VHSAVREGVDAAVAGIEMPIASTFGYDIPPAQNAFCISQLERETVF
jgi:hypothetical protein